MTAAWTRKEGKNPSGGLNEKGRASARAEGHHLKAPTKDAHNARHKSFCERMTGMKRKLTGSAAPQILTAGSTNRSENGDATDGKAILGQKIA